MFLSGLAAATLVELAIQGAISELSHLQERFNDKEIAFGTPWLPSESWTAQHTREEITWFSKGSRSAAIDSINNSKPERVRLDCLAAVQLAAEQGIRTALGDTAYNALAGRLVAGGTAFTKALSGTKPIDIKHVSDLTRGDFVYFENGPQYLRHHPGGPWRGENTIYLGHGKFLGFPVGELTAQQLLDRLVAEYNNGIDSSVRITASNLKAQNRIFRFDEQLLSDLQGKRNIPQP